MTRKTEHRWKPPTWLDDPIPGTARFHDEEVEVYEGTTEVKRISLWRDNYRTLLDLEHLRILQGKKTMREINDDEVIEYIFKQDLHKIPPLAGSIRNNGVRVPLILSHDLILLDGNRRFLACKYLMREEQEEHPNFTIVPVRSLNPSISEELKLKITAEMNFLPQHKEPWPRNVRAQFALQELERAKDKLKDEDKAYEHVAYFLQLSRADLVRFQAVLGMIKEYVAYVEAEGKKARQEAERFGRRKFHFFEEFYNKALIGGKAIQDEASREEAKLLLYKYIRNQQLSSITSIRALASIVRYPPAKKQLQKKGGSFLLAKTMYDDYALPRKASAKITRFCEWLEALSSKEKEIISDALKKRIQNAVLQLMKS